MNRATWEHLNFNIASHIGSLYSLDWITGLTFDPQIPTKMSNFSAVDSPRLQLCPFLCQYILSNRLSSQIGPSNMFSSSA